MKWPHGAKYANFSELPGKMWFYAAVAPNLARIDASGLVSVTLSIRLQLRSLCFRGVNDPFLGQPQDEQGIEDKRTTAAKM